MQKMYKHPRLIIAVIAVITVFFGWQLPKAELDNNNLRFVPHDDPALKTSQWIDQMFGSSFFILIGLERQYGTVFDSEFLNLIRDYTSAVEEIPIVKKVTSLINSDYITSVDDTIVVEKLVKGDFSGTQEEIEELKRRLLSWDMYERALYSDDFTATQILIPLTISSEEASSKEVTEYFLQIRNTAHKVFGDSADVYVTGMPVIVATVNEAMNADLKLLIPVVTLVVLLILFFSFHGFTPVVLPLLTVVISVIWSVGAMPIFGIKLSVISTVLPVILVAVGSAYGIHVVTHYLNGRKKNEMTREEHNELVISTIIKIRKPVFLAALTTFAGFLSFCFTSVAPCREFGYFASFGVASAFIVAITLIPALLIIRGPKKINTGKNSAGENSSVSAFLAENLVIIAKRKKTIVFFAVLVVAFSVYGLSKLIIDNVMVEYFKTDTDIYRSDEFIRRQFGGSKVVSVVAQTESYEKTLRPDTLAAMDGLSVYLQKKVRGVGKVMGFTDLVKRINQVFNASESPEGLRVTTSRAVGSSSLGSSSLGDFGFDSFGFGFDNSSPEPSAQRENSTAGADGEKIYTQSELINLFDRAASRFRGMNASELVWELKRQVNYEGAGYYEIPVDPKRYGKETPEDLQRLISNYLVLLSGNISEYANDSLEPTAVKATVQLRTMGMDDSHAIFREIEKYAKANFPPDVKVTIGGTTMVESSLNNLVVQSQVTSMLFSLICVFIIISLSNKSLIAGCIGITPLTITILLNFAVMGFTGIKLNLGTSMVAAVSVGIGIDYTIHCLEAYKREYKATGGTGDFLRNVFFSSGKAIIINALSVGAGFAVLLLSRFVMLGDLGLLIALTMVSSALVSLTLLPALLALIKPKFVTK
ncbi:MAG: MMPL family transporter [Treponema sp.]|jgi:predicted RND superfamily exporter protein|nr:MMPL family transporter [Treponema sp.]